VSEKEYAGSADLADDLEEIAGRGGNNVVGEGRSPQKAAGWTQNLLRSFVAPSGDSRATGDAAAADPNMDALEAMVTAAKAGGYERARTPPSRQASGALRGMIGLRGAEGGEGTFQDESANATAVVGGDGGDEDGDVAQISIDGWMFKRSGVLFRRWRRRWFQLEVGGPDGPILVRGPVVTSLPCHLLAARGHFLNHFLFIFGGLAPACRASLPPLPPLPLTRSAGPSPPQSLLRHLATVQRLGGKKDTYRRVCVYLCAEVHAGKAVECEISTGEAPKE